MRKKRTTASSAIPPSCPSPQTKNIVTPSRQSGHTLVRLNSGPPRAYAQLAKKAALDMKNTISSGRSCHTTVSGPQLAGLARLPTRLSWPYDSLRATAEHGDEQACYWWTLSISDWYSNAWDNTNKLSSTIAAQAIAQRSGPHSLRHTPYTWGHAAGPIRPAIATHHEDALTGAAWARPPSR